MSASPTRPEHERIWHLWQPGANVWYREDEWPPAHWDSGAPLSIQTGGYLLSRHPYASRADLATRVDWGMQGFLRGPRETTCYVLLCTLPDDAAHLVWRWLHMRQDPHHPHPRILHRTMRAYIQGRGIAIYLDEGPETA